MSSRSFFSRTASCACLSSVVLLGGWTFLSLLATACGQTGAPLPPSLELPTPVDDLSASRVADRVQLKWTMPRRTTDKMPLKGMQPVHICRRLGDGPCESVADVSLPPEKPASYNDVLPAALIDGEDRPLIYSIEVRNHRGRSAGDSNLAYAAAGATPPPFAGASATITADGVLLRWQPAPSNAGQHKVSIQRTLLSVPAKVSKKETFAGKEAIAGSPERSKSPFGSTSAPLIPEQNLIVRLPGGADPGNALDPDAAFGQRYSYRISRINTVMLGGKSVDIEGPSSPEIVIETKDVFPPHVPSGLFAVAAPEDGAIDLSWRPNDEPDLAGYAAYRREGSGTSQRISGTTPLDTPSFRDKTAQTGREYAYSVTAIDRNGNESAASPEAKETLPPKP